MAFFYLFLVWVKINNTASALLCFHVDQNVSRESFSTYPVFLYRVCLKAVFERNSFLLVLHFVRLPAGR